MQPLLIQVMVNTVNDTICGAQVLIMTSIEKLERRFGAKIAPKSLKFNDAKRLLEYYGCQFQNHNGGSHYIVTHPNVRQTIVIPKHHTALKQYNVIDVVRMLEAIKHTNGGLK